MSDISVIRMEGTDTVLFKSNSDKGRKWCLEVTGRMADPIFDVQIGIDIGRRLEQAGYEVTYSTDLYRELGLSL